MFEKEHEAGKEDRTAKSEAEAISKFIDENDQHFCGFMSLMVLDSDGYTKKTKGTSSIGCAKRSCGPPKSGRRLLNGAPTFPPGSAGVPLGPNGASEGPWGCRRVL